GHHLPTCPAIIHLVGGIFTRRSQFQKLLLRGRVLFICRELSIVLGLLAVIVGVVHTRPAVQYRYNSTLPPQVPGWVSYSDQTESRASGYFRMRAGWGRWRQVLAASHIQRHHRPALYDVRAERHGVISGRHMMFTSRFICAFATVGALVSVADAQTAPSRW